MIKRIKHSVSTKKNGVSVQWTSNLAVDSSVDTEMVMQYTLHMYMPTSAYSIVRAATKQQFKCELISYIIHARSLLLPSPSHTHPPITFLIKGYLTWHLLVRVISVFLRRPHWFINLAGWNCFGWSMTGFGVL